MVRREGSRFGVSTGHSMRRSAHTQASAQQRIHSSQSIIVKATADVKLKRAWGQASALLEGHLEENLLSGKALKGFDPETTLAFSLNKSKRWEAMDNLKKEVGYSCWHGNRITIADHHTGMGSHPGESNCIGVYDSQCKKSRRAPRKTYANAHDLIKREEWEEDEGESLEDAEFGTKNRRRRQRKKVKVDKKTGVQLDLVKVNVSYSICVAAPRHTLLTYPKLGVHASYGMMDQTDDDNVEMQSLKRGTKKRNKNPSRDLWEDIHSLDALEDDLDFPDDYDNDQQMEEIDTCTSRSNVTADLGMFIVSTSQSPCLTTQTQRRVLRESRDKKSTKGHIFVIDSKQTECERTVAAGEQEEEAEFHGWFQSDELSAGYLQGEFGNTYQECRSVPRRFAIDVTSFLMSYANDDNVRERSPLESLYVVQGTVNKVVHHIRETLSSPMPMAQPVFMLFASRDIVREEGKEYVDASMRIVGGGSLLPLELTEHVYYGADVMDPMFEKDFVGEADETDRRLWKKLTVYPLETTRKLLKWDYQMQTQEQLGQEIFKGTSGDKQEALRIHEPVFENLKYNGISCGICCEELTPEAGGGTALLSCSHWFCTGCWKGYLLARIGQSDPNINCPEFDCDSKVDPVTIMSLVPSKSFMHHWKQKVNSAIATRKDIIRCPSTDCGYLVRTGVSKSKAEGARPMAGMVIHCEGCRSLWCSECREEAHIPATCAQAAKYRKEKALYLGNVMHIDVPVDFVYYKICPCCNTPIQKTCGSKKMTCICKFVFCWACGMEFSKHGFTFWQTYNKCPEKPTLEYQEYESDEVLRTVPVYEFAIEHRHRRSKTSSTQRFDSAMDLVNAMAINIYIQNTDTDDCLQTSTSTPGVRAATFAHIRQEEDSLLYQLKRFMWNVERFLLEAYYILEYAEVYFGSMATSEHKRVLVQHKNRLAFVAEQLHNIMLQRVRVDKLTCRKRMEGLVRNGKDCIHWIAKGGAKP